MEEEKDILESAAEVLKNEKTPPGPSQELVDKTMARLTKTSGQTETIQLGGRIRIWEKLKTLKNLNKVAAAAILLLVSGYAVGRLSAPRPPDIKQLQRALVPAIRTELLDEINHYLQASYASLTDDLDRKYQQDLNRVGMQILAASNTVTNERLVELAESFNEYQAQERQRFTTMLEHMESNRLQDSALLSNALATVVQRTEEEMERTKQDVVQLLSYSRSDGSIPDASKE
ncbi:hypothetical protein ACFL5Z_12040 [Planctomycetota bacterium]